MTGILHCWSLKPRWLHPYCFFYIPQVRTRVRLEKVLSDRSYSFSSITFEKTRIPNNLEMRKYVAPTPANILQWFTSEECTQKFHTDDMTPPHPHLDRASDLLKQIFSAEWLIRSSTHSRVVTRHQYGISSLVP